MKIFHEYKIIKTLAKRARYKYIEEDGCIYYCHFVFQGYRIEALQEKTDYIICVCKGGAKRKTNSQHNYNNKIIYISNKSDELIFDDLSYLNFTNIIGKYINAHKKWIGREDKNAILQWQVAHF